MKPCISHRVLCGSDDVQIKDTIRQLAAEDVDPPVSEPARYLRSDLTRNGYRHLLAISELLKCILTSPIAQGLRHQHSTGNVAEVVGT